MKRKLNKELNGMLYSMFKGLYKVFVDAFFPEASYFCSEEDASTVINKETFVDYYVTYENNLITVKENEESDMQVAFFRENNKFKIIITYLFCGAAYDTTIDMNDETDEKEIATLKAIFEYLDKNIWGIGEILFLFCIFILPLRN